MKNATLKLCVALALALTTFGVGPTVCYAEEQQTSVAVEESIGSITDDTVTVNIDPSSPDYDMWSIPVEERNNSNFGPAFDKRITSPEVTAVSVDEQSVESTAGDTVAVEATVVETITLETPVSTDTMAEPVAEQAIETEVKQATGTNRWGITLNPEAKEILARIVKLECGGESDLGQQAVIEVIFNRAHSGEWGNGVIGVLSKKGQFSTWKNRYGKNSTPTAKEYRNIEKVLNGETNILPYKTVYFSRGAQNKRIQTRIGGHVFCNR